MYILLWQASQGGAASRTIFPILQHVALCLRHVLDVHVPYHSHPHEAQDHDGARCSQHACLGVAVGFLDGQPLGTPDRVRELDRQAAVDGNDVRQGGRGQVPLEGLFERVRPDGARDGVPDGAADGAADEEHRQDGGDVLVVDAGEDGQLHAEDEDAAGHREEDLAHDDVPDVAVGLAEVDHEADGEDVQRHADPEDPLEPARDADEVARGEEAEERHGAERVGHVARLGQAEVVHHHEEGREVTRVAVVRDLVRHVEQARPQHAPVQEEARLEERRGRHVDLVQREQDQHHEPDHDHGDDVVGPPAVRGPRGQREWQQEHRQAAGEQDHTRYCVFVEKECQRRDHQKRKRDRAK